MNRYSSTLHHVCFTLTAVALTAATVAVSVLLPAHVDFPAHQAMAAARAPSPTPVEIVPARIEVIGVRPQATVSDSGRPAAAAPGRPS